MVDHDEDTIDVRVEEAIDRDALRTWLAAVVPEIVPAGAQLEVRQFPSGFSNLTYRVTLRAEDGARAYVLRRPPRGVKAGSAHDVGREHDLLAALHPLGVPVPRAIARCDRPDVIGAPFYLMEFVDGVILRGAVPSDLPRDADAASATLAQLSHTFVATLSLVHAVDVSSGPLAALGRPEGYVQRQVDGWTRRWHASRTDHVPDLDRVAHWLAAHRPPDRGATLIHNDFKFDNLVLDRATMRRVVAILDWEMATIGDPLMDLGTALAYWVEAGDAPVFKMLGLGVTALPGALSRARVVEAYGAASSRDVSDAAFYYAFGLFKVAVIAQQIYARHVQGLTADPRFATLGTVVAALGGAAADVTTTRVI
ncbi:MAG: phosphotransferase family protein [Gemmatimonadaceae bacterium]|nr:phosphotransferase family protein [Gemmatimonadaceae bacterium]